MPTQRTWAGVCIGAAVVAALALVLVWTNRTTTSDVSWEILSARATNGAVEFEVALTNHSSHTKGWLFQPQRLESGVWKGFPSYTAVLSQSMTNNSFVFVYPGERRRVLVSAKIKALPEQENEPQHWRLRSWCNYNAGRDLHWRARLFLQMKKYVPRLAPFIAPRVTLTNLTSTEFIIPTPIGAN